ncbi:hypothetical protein HHI36_003015 [Cryptolaemus montrouzieri]|uniref:Uncharacterized protein n=1 Tax=Cryptolaemus montrouzieri TaxID=559131 RepID=A0ABD2PD48_9CUCU
MELHRTFIFALCLLSIMEGIFSLDEPLLDPTETCILDCDSCYKGSYLLNCANLCLKTDGLINLKGPGVCNLFSKRA